MKKIVSILAAAAVLATSVFAADLAAKVELEGSVLSKNGDGVGALQLKKLDPTQDAPNFTLSTSGDKSGAQLMNYAGTDAHDVVDSSFVEWNIWFKPFDSLKVTVGNYEYKTNNPHFGWWASLVQYPDYGFAFDYTAGALSATVAFGQNNGNVWSADPWNYAFGTNWFNSEAADGFSKIGNFEALVRYDLGGAGNIHAVIAKGAKVCPHGFSVNNAWKRTDLAFGAGYGNQPWGQTGYFFDVAGVMKKNGDKMDFNELDAQMYLEYHADAITVYLVNCIGYSFVDGAEKPFKDGFEARVTYAGNISGYLEIEGYNVMNKAFVIQPSLTGSVGSMSYDVGVKLEFNDGFANWSVPFKLGLGF